MYFAYYIYIYIYIYIYHGILFVPILVNTDIKAKSSLQFVS